MSVFRSRIGSNGHGPQVRSVGLLLFEAAKQGSLENLEFALGLPGGKSQLELGREGSVLTDAFVKCLMNVNNRRVLYKTITGNLFLSGTSG